MRVARNELTKNPEGVALNERRTQSIPNIPFVDFHTMPSADLAEFALEGHRLVMFFLVCDVAFDLFDVGWAHREDSVSALPLELL